MRDALGVQMRAGKHVRASRSFVRVFAIAVAIVSFLAESSSGIAQTNPVDAQMQRLVHDGALAARGTWHQSLDRKTSARLVAERIDELSGRPASRADIETMREVIEALKDELDAANIRIDKLQERLDAATLASPPTGVAPALGSHVGAPLDPLADAYTHRTHLSARLFGLVDDGQALTLGIESSTLVALRFDDRHLASLVASDFHAMRTDVTSMIFGRIAQAAQPARVEVASVPAPQQNQAADRTDVVRTTAVSGKPVESGRSDTTPHVVQSTTPRTRVASADSATALVNSITANSDFDRAMRAAEQPTSLSSIPQKTLAYPVIDAFEQTGAAGGTAAYRAYAPTVRGMGNSVSVPVKVGRTKVTTKTSMSHLEQASAYVGASANAAAPVAATNKSQFEAASVDTSFTVPAFHKDVTIHVRGGYDHLRHPDTTALPYYRYDASTSNYDVANTAGTGASAIVVAPNNPDVQRYTYGASAAVPVTRNLNVGVGYSTQHLSGTYGAAVNGPPANRKDAYSGSLTYAPGGGKSSVTIIGREYRYSDNASPNLKIKETRGDVLFSVKF